MPRVAPFAGLHYSLARFGASVVPQRVRVDDDDESPPSRVADLTDVVCPPYDVISHEQREGLLDRHERNAVRLEYSAEADSHAAAAGTLANWAAEGTLERRSEAVVYYYRHGSASVPGELLVEGVMVRVLLEPWGGGIRPHEHTMPGPKADRLALLRSTRTQLSPILAIYFDRSDRYRHVMARAWDTEWRARDGDGLLHQLAMVEADDRLLGFLGRQTLFVADGHHRYETALAWQAEVRSDPRWMSAPQGALAVDWTMMMVVNAELTELDILPTHRILLDADADALRGLVAGDDPLFEAIPVAPASLGAALAERREDEGPMSGSSCRAMTGISCWAIPMASTTGCGGRG